MLIDEKLIVFGNYKLKIQAIGLYESSIKFRKPISNASLCFRIIEKIREFVEEYWRVNPCGRRAAKSFLYPKTRTFQCLLYFILFKHGQSPYDGLIGFNPSFDLGVDKLTHQIVLLLEFIGVKKILYLHNFIRSLVVLKEVFEWGQVIMHIDCISVEVDAH